MQASLWAQHEGFQLAYRVQAAAVCKRLLVMNLSMRQRCMQW